jgi:hypothetical protein
MTAAAIKDAILFIMVFPSRALTENYSRLKCYRRNREKALTLIMLFTSRSGAT